MLKALQWAFWMIGLGLQGAVMLTLSQGPWRDFPALFAYIASLAATTTGEILAFSVLGKTSASFKSYYWSAELVRQSALFALVAALAIHAVPAGRKSEAYSRLLTVAAVIVWLASIFVYYNPDLGVWMTAAVRNMSFITGVLNLIAWFAYARAGARDTTRLMIAGGLGLQMTGEAIGQAVRQMGFSNQASLAGGIFIVITHLLCLFIWWRALIHYDPYSPRSRS